MSGTDENIIRFLIAGGLIGTALGALLSKDKGEGSMIGAIAGAVILATYKANEQARKAHLPVYIEEDRKLYEIQSGSSKKYIKDIPKPDFQLKEHFKLK
jgi:hypothetical protein